VPSRLGGRESGRDCDSGGSRFHSNCLKITPRTVSYLCLVLSVAAEFAVPMCLQKCRLGKRRGHWKRLALAVETETLSTRGRCESQFEAAASAVRKSASLYPSPRKIASGSIAYGGRLPDFHAT